MKTKTFRVKTIGSYVTAYVCEVVPVQPLLDINYFDGSRTLAEAKVLLDLLQKAVAHCEQIEPRTTAQQQLAVRKQCLAICPNFTVVVFGDGSMSGKWNLKGEYESRASEANADAVVFLERCLRALERHQEKIRMKEAKTPKPGKR